MWSTWRIIRNTTIVAMSIKTLTMPFHRFLNPISLVIIRVIPNPRKKFLKKFIVLVSSNEYKILIQQRTHHPRHSAPN